MTEFPFLRTERVILRLAEQADAPAMATYARENREFLKPWEPERPEEYYTESWWTSRIAQNRGLLLNGKAVRLMLFEHKEPGRPIGICNFNDIVRGAAHFCNMGYAIAEHAQGKGLMTEACRAGIDYMFDVQQLHRIHAAYMPSNQRSARVLQRLGFTIEGEARDYLIIDGQWQDHILTGLINPRWQLQV